MAERSRWLKYTPACDRHFPKSIVAPSALVERFQSIFPDWKPWIKPDATSLLFRERHQVAHRVYFVDKLYIEQFPTELRRRWHIYLHVDHRDRQRLRDTLSELGQTVGGTSTVERNVMTELLPEDDRLFPDTTVQPHQFINRLLRSLGDVRVGIQPASMEHRGGTITIYRKRMYRYQFPIALVHLPTSREPARFSTLEGTWARRRRFYQHLALILFQMGEQRYPIGN